MRVRWTTLHDYKQEEGEERAGKKYLIYGRTDSDVMQI